MRRNMVHTVCCSHCVSAGAHSNMRDLQMGLVRDNDHATPLHSCAVWSCNVKHKRMMAIFQHPSVVAGGASDHDSSGY